MISKKELIILRDLAKKQMEFATSDKTIQLKKEWTAHGAFKGKKPMILIELGTFNNDVIPQMLRCQEEEARGLEYMLLSNTINYEDFKDDFIVKDYLNVGWETYMKPWNIDVKVERAESEDNLGHHFISQIHDLEEDFHKFQKSSFHISKNSAYERINYLNDMFGDIIPAKLSSGSLYASPTQNLVHIMSMEDMFVAMCDYPDTFLKVMDMQANDQVEFFKTLEKEGYLLPTTAEEWCGQGTYCFTDELPNKPEGLSLKDVWGYVDSQETVGVSAEMFDELIFPSYKKITQEYGLLSYGCCEPVDPIWERCISKLDNLRKVSISPWCNEEYMGEQLKGKKIVFLRKPSPNFLGVGATLDEEACKENIKKTIMAAKGCALEFSQRDVYQINKDVRKVARFVEIIREQVENFY